MKLRSALLATLVCLTSTEWLPAEDATILLKTFATEFVEITPGRGRYPADFRFGEGAEARQVALSQPFAIAAYEVPQNLYEAVMGSNPSRWQGPRNSVEMMTATEAVEFCHKATELMRAAGLLTATEEIRLPTEVEWEYCCRAGTATRYSFGDEARAEGDSGAKASLLDKYGWHTGNAAGNDPAVGALAANPWGLHDVHGYLWEFTQAAGESDTKSVVVRGGSWKDRYEQLRSSARREIPAAARDDAIGFRCVKAAVSKPAQ